MRYHHLITSYTKPHSNAGMERKAGKIHPITPIFFNAFSDLNARFYVIEWHFCYLHWNCESRTANTREQTKSGWITKRIGPSPNLVILTLPLLVNTEVGYVARTPTSLPHAPTSHKPSSHLANFLLQVGGPSFTQQGWAEPQTSWYFLSAAARYNHAWKQDP